jgi:hypothetical protein
MGAIHLGRIRFGFRRGVADAPFFEDGATPAPPPIITTREEAESLAAWNRARCRAVPRAPTARELTALGLYGGALLALTRLDLPSFGTEAGGWPQATPGGDGAVGPAAIDGSAAPGTSFGLGWVTLRPVQPTVPPGTGAEVIWPLRLLAGSANPLEALVGRAEAATLTPLAAPAESRAEPVAANAEMPRAAGQAPAMSLPETADEVPGAPTARPVEATRPAAPAETAPAPAAPNPAQAAPAVAPPGPGPVAAPQRPAADEPVAAAAETPAPFRAQQPDPAVEVRERWAGRDTDAAPPEAEAPASPRQDVDVPGRPGLAEASPAEWAQAGPPSSSAAEEEGRAPGHTPDRPIREARDAAEDAAGITPLAPSDTRGPPSAIPVAEGRPADRSTDPAGPGARPRDDAASSPPEPIPAPAGREVAEAASPPPGAPGRSGDEVSSGPTSPGTPGMAEGGGRDVEVPGRDVAANGPPPLAAPAPAEEPPPSHAVLAEGSPPAGPGRGNAPGNGRDPENGAEAPQRPTGEPGGPDRGNRPEEPPRAASRGEETAGEERAGPAQRADDRNESEADGAWSEIVRAWEGGERTGPAAPPRGDGARQDDPAVPPGQEYASQPQGDWAL